jgi:hypothetical protein
MRIPRPQFLLPSRPLSRYFSAAPSFTSNAPDTQSLNEWCISNEEEICHLAAKPSLSVTLTDLIRYFLPRATRHAPPRAVAKSPAASAALPYHPRHSSAAHVSRAKTCRFGSRVVSKRCATSRSSSSPTRTSRRSSTTIGNHCARSSRSRRLVPPPPKRRQGSPRS